MLRPSRRSDALVLGDDVGTPQPVQLDPVLEGAQERVGVVQRLAVLAADVPAAGQLGQRAQRGGRPDPLVGAAVHELEQLDGELDVAQPAGAELELALGLAGRGCARSPGGASPGCPRRSRRARPPSTPSAGPSSTYSPAERRGRRRPARALSSAWNSQVLGPALVVAPVAGEGAGQRPGLALGAQRRVDRPDRALAGVLGADPHQVAGQLGGGPERRGPRRRLRSAGSCTKITSTSET